MLLSQFNKILKYLLIILIFYFYLSAQLIFALEVDKNQRKIGQDIPKGKTAEELYQQGKRIQDTYDLVTDDILKKAIAYFEKAIAIDKKYILSYLAISDSLVDIAYSGYDDTGKETYDTRLLQYAISFIEQAEQINSNLPEFYRSKAVLLNALHDLAGAEEEINKALLLEAENPEYNYVFGHILYNQFLDSKEQALIEQAIKQYEKVLTLKTTERLRASVYDWLGKIYWFELNDNKKAKDMFETSLQLKPYSPKIYNRYAAVLNELKDYDKAIEASKKGLQLKNLKILHNNLGKGYLGKGEYDKAEVEFLYTKNIDELLNIVEIYSDQGEFDKLMNICQKILELEPDNFNALLLLGYAYEGKGDLNTALLNYNKVKELKPEYAQVYFRIGYVYDIQNNYNEAIENYKLAIKYDPRDLTSLSNLAALYLDTGQNDLASDCYEKLYKLNPKDANLLNDIGNSYYRLGQKEQAIKYYERAAELGINILDNYLYLGNIYLEKKEYQKAVPVFEKALLMNKNSPEVLNDLAWAYAQLNTNLTKAVSLADEAYKLAPQRREVLDTLLVCNVKLGNMYLEKKEYEKAVPALEKALLIDRNSPKVLSNLSWAYAQLNINLTKAVSLAEEAYKLAPKRGETLDILVVCNIKLGLYYLKSFKFISAIKAFIA